MRSCQYFWNDARYLCECARYQLQFCDTYVALYNNILATRLCFARRHLLGPTLSFILSSNQAYTITKYNYLGTISIDILEVKTMSSILSISLITVAKSPSQ